MRRLRVAFALTSIAAALIACGTPSNITPGGGGAAPDSPVTGTPSGDDGLTPSPEPATPRPGMAGVRAIGWDRYEKTKDPRVLRVYYWSGVEPCYVLDRVEVSERRKKVVVTLYQGHDPSDPDTACIEIAVERFVEVELESPLGGRRVVDGARN